MPLTINLTPEAVILIRGMSTDVDHRLREEGTKRVDKAVEANVGLNMEEYLQFEVEAWRNLAVTLINLICLGGDVRKEDEHNLIARNDFITYGVNQSSHSGLWSINS